MKGNSIPYKKISAFLFLLCFATICLPCFSYATPLPDIKANNSDIPIILNNSDTLSLTASLSPGTSSGVNADWWVAAVTPFGWHYYVYPDGWYYTPDLLNIQPAYQGALFTLSPVEVLYTSGLPTGTYVFYFGVDTVMNGQLDFSSLSYDFVVADILQDSMILSVNPFAFATEAGMDTQVQATFNVAMDAASINTGTFSLTSLSGINVNGIVSYDAGTRTATFTPSMSLAPLTWYTATISGVRDSFGQSMSTPYSWSFMTVTGFWAYDFVLDSEYFVSASLVGEGAHCMIYLENGQWVDPNAINEITNQFDNAIYMNEISVFGAEPNPGIDGNTRVFILLLDIRDGYTPTSGYIAGYFNPLDEYDISVSPYSNQKELFNMDINPGIPGDAEFNRTLAHEFQHMISWNQKTNIRGVFEDIWLEEAMSEVAPLFCNYAPDYSRVIGYQYLPWDSLVTWYGDLYDYSTVYMWSQYVKDRVTNTDSSGHNVFWHINHTANVGMNAVNTALSAVGYGKDFANVFRDWSMANYLGITTIPGHPEWSYTSIHTESGYMTGFGPLPGLPFNDSAHINAPVVGGLHQWGVDYFRLTKPGPGTVTWTMTSPTDEAAFIDLNTNTVTFNMGSGIAYPYTNSGILIARNPTDFEKWTATGGGTMTSTSVRAEETLTVPTYRSKDAVMFKETAGLLTPKALLLEISSDPVLKTLSDKTGRPIPVCVDHFFRDREKALRKDLLNDN
jgi:hypothetical protein